MSLIKQSTFREGNDFPPIFTDKEIKAEVLSFRWRTTSTGLAKIISPEELVKTLPQRKNPRTDKLEPMAVRFRAEHVRGKKPLRGDNVELKFNKTTGYVEEVYGGTYPKRNDLVKTMGYLQDFHYGRARGSIATEDAELLRYDAEDIIDGELVMFLAAQVPKWEEEEEKDRESIKEGRQKAKKENRESIRAQRGVTVEVWQDERTNRAFYIKGLKPLDPKILATIFQNYVSHMAKVVRDQQFDDEQVDIICQRTTEELFNKLTSGEPVENVKQLLEGPQNTTGEECAKMITDAREGERYKMQELVVEDKQMNQQMAKDNNSSQHDVNMESPKEGNQTNNNTGANEQEGVMLIEDDGDEPVKEIIKMVTEFAQSVDNQNSNGGNTETDWGTAWNYQGESGHQQYNDSGNDYYDYNGYHEDNNGWWSNESYSS